MPLFKTSSLLATHFLIMLVLFPLQAAWAQSASAVVPAENAGEAMNAERQKPVLQGGVKHSEKLPGLEDSLRPGKVYSDDLLMRPGAPSSTQWFYIPSWYAGARHSEEHMIVYRHDYETGTTTAPMQMQLNRQDSLSGFQLDKNGGIWDFKRVPLIRHIESDFDNGVMYVKKITPLVSNEERLVIKYDEISISLDKLTNKIISVVQQEQINTTTCPEPGVLRIDVSAKSFDLDGAPQRLEQAVTISKVVKPFAPIDQYEGQDLRPLFREYLMSHNLESLVPDKIEK